MNIKNVTTLLRKKPEMLTVNPEQKPYIYTEIYQCAKIGKIALDSLVIHHPNTTIHIYGTPEDFSAIEHRPNFEFHDLSQETQILENFNSGHLGTASLWAKILLERKERYVIHFDSDVIFRGPAFDEILMRLEQGYSIVGPRRNYQHNPNNRDNVRYLADVSQTMCFGFDRGKITARNYATLTKMCRGMYNPYGHPVIDFFDPVMFDILRNGGKTFFLDPDVYGGCDAYGSRANKYPDLNTLIDFGDRFVHFSSVGSGMYYLKHKDKVANNVAATYIQYAIEKYAVFCKIFYQEDIGVAYDANKYQPIFSIQDWFNRG